MKHFEAFFWGMLGAAAALLLELPLSLLKQKEILGVLAVTIIISALIEEAVKLAIIFRHFTKKLAGKKMLSACFLLGAGFAAAEIFLISLGSGGFPFSQWKDLAGIAILHASTAGIIGYFWLNPFSPKHLWKTALFAAAAVHLVFNFLVLSKENLGGFPLLIFLSVLIILSFRNYLKTR